MPIYIDIDILISISILQPSLLSIDPSELDRNCIWYISILLFRYWTSISFLLFPNIWLPNKWPFLILGCNCKTASPYQGYLFYKGMFLIQSFLSSSILGLNFYVSEGFDVFRTYLCRNLVLSRSILVYGAYISCRLFWYIVSISFSNLCILHLLMNPILAICWFIRSLLILFLNIPFLDIYMDICYINRLQLLYWSCWLVLSFPILSIFFRNQLSSCWNRYLLMGYPSPSLDSILVLSYIFLWQYIDILTI